MKLECYATAKIRLLNKVSIGSNIEIKLYSCVPRSKSFFVISTVSTYDFPYLYKSL